MEKILIVLVALIGLVVIACILSVPVWLLWNWLMPELFSLKPITFVQAMGLSVLCSLLFKSSSSSSK